MRANGKITACGSLVIVLLLLLTSADESGAKPIRRAKRVSDQRLAELETLIALSKMKEKMVTVPIGFGVVDPQKLGRRRRHLGDGSDDAQDHLFEPTEPITINR
ncbi:uncharacterized protein LOC124154263 [Ischnura elegans]|uniref:uncharacterized protein LOC124154263 n=1 Tax=Ischnura elegans TaxID=197161 RepID=UPI001ED87B41|nr:uncharacterized protein LOC124154263 [Ischnura elegans]